MFCSEMTCLDDLSTVGRAEPSQLSIGSDSPTNSNQREPTVLHTPRKDNLHNIQPRAHEPMPSLLLILNLLPPIPRPRELPSEALHRTKMRIQISRPFIRPPSSTNTPFLLVIQRRFQSTIQAVMPFCTYCESVCSRTRQGRLRVSSARMTAVNSIRLLVVPASPPCNSFMWGPQRSTAPQPPGPGFPLHAPSV